MKALIKGEQNKEEKNEKEEEGIANPCLMTQNYKVNLKNSSNFLFDELLEAFHELMNEYKKIRLKIKNLKGLIFF